MTLVIDNEQGRRVRNLISETSLPRRRKRRVVGRPGRFAARPPNPRGTASTASRSASSSRAATACAGCGEKPLTCATSFSIYNAGSPAWETADGTGAWLANHTPPCGALFVPGDRAPGGKPLVYLGSFVSEGGHGLAWVDLEGRKQGGVGWVGGAWTGGPFLARDDGPRRDTNAALYVAAPWSTEMYLDRAKDKRGEVRLTAITTKGAMKPVLKHVFTPSFATNAAPAGDKNWFGEFGGLAARDGVLVFSLPKLNQIIFVDTRNTNNLAQAHVKNPGGLAFDLQGRLLVLSDNQLLRFTPGPAPGDLGTPEIFVGAGLESPRALALDSAGRVFIADHGASHQVKVFSAAGQFLHAIGKPGAPNAGRYDPLHLNHPDGLSVDAQGRLWVTENDYQPKRVSVWTTDGQFVRAFYGPSEYGGGGTLDPEDKTKFYFHGMEFRLDWAKGEDQLARVFWRADATDFKAPDGYGATGLPERPLYLGGRRYFANADNSNPTGGPGVLTLWRDDGEVARPVAALGRAHDWKLLKSDAFKPLWPAGANPAGDYWQNATLFAWSDLNDDGRAQTNEVQMRRAVVGSVNIAPDLSLLASRAGANAMRYPPVRFTPGGAPIYDLAAGEVLARDVQEDRPPRAGIRRSGSRAVGPCSPPPAQAICAAVARRRVPRRANVVVSEPLARPARLPRIAPAAIPGHDHRLHALARRLRHAARRCRPALGRQWQPGQHVSVHRRRLVRGRTVPGCAPGQILVHALRPARHAVERAHAAR